MSRPLSRFAVLAMVTLSLGTLSACGDDEDTSSAAPNKASETDQNTPNETDDNGRAFDSSDDAVITALLAALSKAESAAWEGSSLVIQMGSGSMNDPTSPGMCTAVNGIIADDEQGVLVFSDGEIDCDDPHAHLK